MTAPSLAAVARWLAARPHTQIPYAACRPLLPSGAGLPEAAELRAVVNDLHRRGCIQFIHRWRPVVAILDRAELRRLAAGVDTPIQIGE